MHNQIDLCTDNNRQMMWYIIQECEGGDMVGTYCVTANDVCVCVCECLWVCVYDSVW